MPEGKKPPINEAVLSFLCSEKLGWEVWNQIHFGKKTMDSCIFTGLPWFKNFSAKDVVCGMEFKVKQGDIVLCQGEEMDAQNISGSEVSQLW